MQLGSTTSTGEQLQVTGTARVTQSAFIGTSSGGLVVGDTTLTSGTVLDVVGSNSNIPFLLGGTRNGLLGLKIYNTISTQASFISLDDSRNTSSTDFFIIKYNSSHATLPNQVDITNALSGPIIISTNNTERMRFSADGNIGVKQTTFGTAAVGVIAQGNGTAPTTSPADCFQLYSADITAGNAAAHFRTEGGAVVKIYQQTTAVGTAARVGGGGTNVTDTDTFGGYTLGQIVQALQNAGFLA
jgi:hypothetical protein